MGAPKTLVLIPVLVTGIQSDQVFGLKERFLAAQTRVGWIPVTSTGMKG
jgi:hypothetical protein